MIKQCVVCGGEFEARTSRVKACSPACSHALERDAENKRRASKTLIRVCVVCESTFRPKGPQKVCSHKCGEERDRHRDATRDRDVHRELCRDWRRRNPDRQKASTKRWQESNRERYLEANRRRCAKWRESNPGVKAAEARAYREKSDQPKKYQAARTAAYQLVRTIEKFGPPALSPAFREPEPPAHKIKAREQARRWRERNPRYKPPKRPRDKQIASQRRHHARESASLKLVRELQSKGLEVLL